MPSTESRVELPFPIKEVWRRVTRNARSHGSPGLACILVLPFPPAALRVSILASPWPPS